MKIRSERLYTSTAYSKYTIQSKKIRKISAYASSTNCMLQDRAFGLRHADDIAEASIRTRSFRK